MMSNERIAMNLSLSNCGKKSIAAEFTFDRGFQHLQLRVGFSLENDGDVLSERKKERQGF